MKKLITNKKFIFALVIIILLTLITIAVINSLYNESAIESVVGSYYAGRETNSLVNIIYTAEFGENKIAVVERGFDRLGWTETYPIKVSSGDVSLGTTEGRHTGYFDSQYFMPDLYCINLSADDENGIYQEYILIVNQNDDVKTMEFNRDRDGKSANKKIDVSTSEGKPFIELVNMSKFRDGDSYGWTITFLDEDGNSIKLAN